MSLPPGKKSLAEIQAITDPADQLLALVRLFEYLLFVLDPEFEPKKPGVGERADHFSHLFSKLPLVMRALGIRNSLEHPKSALQRPPTEAEVRSACRNLFQAIEELMPHFAPETALAARGTLQLSPGQTLPRTETAWPASSSHTEGRPSPKPTWLRRLLAACGYLLLLVLGGQFFATIFGAGESLKNTKETPPQLESKREYAPTASAPSDPARSMNKRFSELGAILRRLEASVAEFRGLREQIMNEHRTQIETLRKSGDAKDKDLAKVWDKRRSLDLPEGIADVRLAFEALQAKASRLSESDLDLLRNMQEWVEQVLDVWPVLGEERPGPKSAEAAVMDLRQVLNRLRGLQTTASVPNSTGSAR